MKLDFNQNTTIGDLKAQFNTQFKHVKLEFYNRSHTARSGSLPVDQVPDHVLLKEFMKEGTAVHAEFEKTIKISDLEKVFEQDFNLHVQVFRHYGNSWLQTTMSDHWTLQMAEMAAEELEELKQTKLND